MPHQGVTTMTYHTRKDLPCHCALADAFTICDNYHCSVIGPTDPNRCHILTLLGPAYAPDRYPGRVRRWDNCREDEDMGGVAWHHDCSLCAWCVRREGERRHPMRD